MGNKVDINTAEGWNELAKRANSRYLESQGIEPTEKALAELDAELRTWLKFQPQLDLPIVELTPEALNAIQVIE
jgi:hypothetical protein